MIIVNVKDTQNTNNNENYENEMVVIIGLTEEKDADGAVGKSQLSGHFTPEMLVGSVGNYLDLFVEAIQNFIPDGIDKKVLIRSIVEDQLEIILANVEG